MFLVEDGYLGLRTLVCLGQDIDPLLMFASLLKVGRLAGSQVGAQILIGVGTSI